MEIQTTNVFIHATQPQPAPAVTLAFVEKFRNQTFATKTTET